MFQFLRSVALVVAVGANCGNAFGQGEAPTSAPHKPVAGPEGGRWKERISADRLTDEKIVTMTNAGSWANSSVWSKCIGNTRIAVPRNCGPQS
jgi:hypothetical protein